MIYFRHLFASGSFTKIKKFGMCITNGLALYDALITCILPVFLICLITVYLDVYLTIKVCKQIEKETSYREVIVEEGN